jgi:CheY-like chemotaxis protein
MESSPLYGIIKEIVAGLAAKDKSYALLPENLDEDASLTDLGLDITTLPEVALELERRLGGRNLSLSEVLNPEDVNDMTMGDFLRHTRAALAASAPRNPLVVYVDDEEENIFVFKRKYGKKLNLKAFTNSREALDFIKGNDDVALVITDEVMPGLGGNQLCDEVHKARPEMKFILMTGNPNSDGDLMYRSLKANRFYDFINKPVDFEGKGEEYLRMIEAIISPAR